MGGEELKIVNPGYSFKEFCSERGTEKWTLVTGHVGSSTGSISHRDYYSMFVCRENDRKVGGLII